MKVNLNKLSYNFDETGATTSVTAEFNSQDTYPEFLNARLEIVTDDLEKNNLLTIYHVNNLKN